MAWDRLFKNKVKINSHVIKFFGISIVFITIFFVLVHHLGFFSDESKNIDPIDPRWEPKTIAYGKVDLFSDLIIIVNTELDPIYEDSNEKILKRTYIYPDERTLAKIGGITRRNTTHLEDFYLSIQKSELYSESDTTVDKVLHDLATLPILAMQEEESESGVKIAVKYPRDIQAHFQPIRFGKEELSKNAAQYNRHKAEIAAFHLDRILGFRRALPVTGRSVNILTEIFDVTNRNLIKSHYKSSTNDTCFVGFCGNLCHTDDPICGNQDKLEGSFVPMLPQLGVGGREVWTHPWKQFYGQGDIILEPNKDYCLQLQTMPLYSRGRRLLDLIDMSIFDFIIGNQLRDTYETFKVFGDESFTLHLNNGRGFAKSQIDELGILAPMIQCCQIRHSTLKTLLRLQNGPQHLSNLMKKSLAKDPIAPILLDSFYQAMDRRVQKILNKVRKFYNDKRKPTSTYKSRYGVSTERAYNERKKLYM